LAKKKKGVSRGAPATSQRSFDLEQSPWFAPAAFALIFVALVILFRKFLFSDEMLYGSDTIQAGIFFRSFLVDFVQQHGAVPRWNPYIFGGLPYIDAFHGDIFYPLSVLKFFGNIFRMLGLNLFIHIFLAGVFMYLTARQFRLSKIPALIAGVCYMFAPYLVSFVAPGHDGKIFVTTLYPLVILFVERGFLVRPFFNFSMVGLVIGLIILSPHPQMSYFMLWSVALYVGFKLVMLYLEKRRVKPLIRPAMLAAYAVVIGLLLSAIQFYPGFVYTNEYSPRGDTKSGWEWATSWSMHEEEAMSLLIPEFAGVSAQDTETYYWGKNFFKDNSEAVGAVTFFLALLGAFFCRRREGYFFAGLAVLALIYALGATTPIFRLFYYLIPKVKALRAPSMIMFLFSFSAALLAGMAIQRLRDLKDEALSKRFDYVLWGFPGFLLLMAVLFGVAGRGMLNAWTAIFYSDASTIQVQQGVTKMTLAYANLPAIQSGAWFAFLFVALAAVCIWLFRSGKAGAGILAVLVLVPLVDGARFDSRFISTMDAGQQTQRWSANPITDFLTRQDGQYRAKNFRVLPTDMLPYHGIPVVVGYHGNQLRWYDDLLGGPELTNEANPRVLNLAGAKWLVVPASQKMPDNYFGEKPVTEVMTLGSIAVLQNDNALPRVYLVDRYLVIEDRKEIYPLVAGGSDKLRRIVYLEEEPEIEIPIDSLDTDSTWIIDYQPDTVVLGLQVASNKLLVLTDNWYDSWQVYLDGRPAKVMRAYGSFRAVAVPAGTTGAMFVYKSERYRLGKLVTVLTIIYLLGVAGLQIVQSRRRRKQEEATG